MKKSTTLSIFFSALISSVAYAQDIDPSIISDLSPEQIEFVKNQLGQGNEVYQAEKPKLKESTVNPDFDYLLDDDGNLVLDKIDKQEPKSELEKFGYDFFSSIPTSISAVGDLPLPNEYVISLNDQFRVVLSGNKEAIYDLNVNLDGSLSLPDLGSISVAGETFEDVKSKLDNLVNQSYIGTEIDLSLKSLSAKKITIVGAVNNAGTYLVNPFSTISSSLAYSGGISDIGTLRNIKLIRVNGNSYNFDLYDMLIYGDRSKDITIQSGDVILVGPSKSFVELTGEVMRPAIYEVLERENLNTIIEFALGLTQQANKNSITLSVLDTNSASIVSRNVSNLEIPLKNVVSLKVNPYVTKKSSNISVYGAIKEPRDYSLKEISTLGDLIDEVEFVDVYPWLAILEQFDQKNLTKKSTLFSLKDSRSYNTIELLENSKVFFLNIEDRYIKNCDLEEISPVCPNDVSIQMMKDFSLSIDYNGRLIEMPVIGSFKAKSLINFLGLDMNNIDSKVLYLSPLEGFSVDQDYNVLSVQASKFHSLKLRSKNNNTITVNVSGAVQYPGLYKLTPNTTLDQLYNKIGDFRSDASIESIIIQRQSIKDKQIRSFERSKNQIEARVIDEELQSDKKQELINLIDKDIDYENLGRIAGDFSPNSQASKNFILYEGDEITIPTKSYLINVFGEVLNPISFEYSKGLNISNVIESAGGYSQYADKKGVYIIKPNGLIEKANRNIFLGNVQIMPGDSIIVPKRLPRDDSILNAILPATQILSDLAFAATALDNLKN